MISNDTNPGALLETMMLVRAFEEQNRASAAAGNGPASAHDLGQRATGIGAACEQMSGASVIRENQILLAQCFDDADCGCFLPYGCALSPGAAGMMTRMTLFG